MKQCGLTEEMIDDLEMHDDAGIDLQKLKDE